MHRKAIIVIALLFTACASAPRVKHPQLEQLDTQSTPADSAKTVTTLWWQDFDDVRLDSLIQTSLTQNYNLLAAVARLDAAAAQATIAGAPVYPQLNGAASGSRRKQNFIGLPIPNARGGVLTSTSENYGLSLNLSWELDLWGRLRAGKAAALADFQASRIDFEGVRISLAGQTAKAWFAAIEARRQMELAQATFENFRTSADQIDSRYERGLRTSFELILARSNVASAEAVLKQRQQNYQIAKRQVELLLGNYPSGTIAVADTLPKLDAAPPEGLGAQLLQRRPDIAAAERRLAGSAAQIRAAKAALFPQISLTGSSGTSTDEVGDLLKSDFSVWSLAGNLLQPIFQGGRLRANVKLAEARNLQAFAGYAQTALNAYAEVESALEAEAFLRDQEAAVSVAASEAVNARALAERQYDSGLVGLITLLETQRRAFDAESQLIAIQRARLASRIDLYLALGGGFDIQFLNQEPDTEALLAGTKASSR